MNGVPPFVVNVFGGIRSPTACAARGLNCASRVASSADARWVQPVVERRHSRVATGRERVRKAGARSVRRSFYVRQEQFVDEIAVHKGIARIDDRHADGKRILPVIWNGKRARRRLHGKGADRRKYRRTPVGLLKTSPSQELWCSSRREQWTFEQTPYVSVVDQSRRVREERKMSLQEVDRQRRALIGTPASDIGITMKAIFCVAGSIGAPSIARSRTTHLVGRDRERQLVRRPFDEPVRIWARIRSRRQSA